MTDERASRMMSAILSAILSADVKDYCRLMSVDGSKGTSVTY
jgi:hypothetical protein